MGMPIIEPGTITKEEAISDIIDSIALEETSIAHILNAESEKLQVIINMPDVTLEQLMAANNSVKNTIDNIIQHELVLKDKLNMFKNIICQTN